MRPDLLALAAKLSARDEPFALVTVVRREPPSSARVGDAALVTEAGEYHGWARGGWPGRGVARGAAAAHRRGRAAPAQSFAFRKRGDPARRDAASTDGLRERRHRGNLRRAGAARPEAHPLRYHARGRRAGAH